MASARVESSSTVVLMLRHSTGVLALCLVDRDLTPVVFMRLSVFFRCLMP
jgi:hypothetical protein